VKAGLFISKSLLVLIITGFPGSVATTGDQSDGGFAVVELFTSEGCSSCPPADRFLNDLVIEATNGRSIYPLAFHVDYWDYIGWKDRFARPEFTERQRRYSVTFRLSSIYTPQMIVNGNKEFVGSDKLDAQRAIGEALNSSSIFRVAIHSTFIKDDWIKVEFSLTNGSLSQTLNLALVERNIQSRVGRGENSGRTLLHDNVVRDWKSIPRSPERGSVDMKIPGDAKKGNISIIAFLQDPETMRIQAAAMSDIR